MANTLDIRRRIRSVKNTAQITKAMQMVAASKMRRAQATALLGRNPEVRETGPDGQEHVAGYDHVFRVFQRNIPEHGGDQPSPSVAGLVPKASDAPATIVEVK